MMQRKQNGLTALFRPFAAADWGHHFLSLDKNSAETKGELP